MYFRRFISILEAHGFALARQRGSHRTYQGVVDGNARVVIVACHRESDDIIDDPPVGAAEGAVPPLKFSRRHWHGELMPVSVVAAREQPADHVQDESQPNRKRHPATEEGRLLVGWKIGDGLEIERNRFLQRTEHLLERPTLHGDIEVEADRLPVAISPLGIAMQGSGCQLRTRQASLSCGSPPAGRYVERSRELRNFPSAECPAVRHPLAAASSALAISRPVTSLWPAMKRSALRLWSLPAAKA